MASCPTTISNAQDFSDDDDEIESQRQEIYSPRNHTKNNISPFDEDPFKHSKASFHNNTESNYGAVAYEETKHIPPSMLSEENGKRANERKDKAFPFSRPFDKLGGKKSKNRKGTKSPPSAKPFQSMQEFSDEEECIPKKSNSKVEFSDSENEDENEDDDTKLFRADKRNFEPKSNFFSYKKKNNEEDDIDMSDPFGLAALADKEVSKTDLHSTIESQAQDLFGSNVTNKKNKGKDKKEKEKERKKFLEDVSAAVTATTTAVATRSKTSSPVEQESDGKEKDNTKNLFSKPTKNLKGNKLLDKETPKTKSKPATSVTKDALALLDSLTLESEKEVKVKNVMVSEEDDEDEDELGTIFRRKIQQNSSPQKRQKDTPLFDDEDDTLGSAAFYCEDEEENRSNSAIGILLEEEIKRKREKLQKKKTEEVPKPNEENYKEGRINEIAEEEEALRFDKVIKINRFQENI